MSLPNKRGAKNLRIYGNAPFDVALIHGGPGAAGELAPVARELAKTHGALEPLQTRSTLQGQLQELKIVLEKSADLPVRLIGFSWGAFLSFIFAAGNPSLVKKLILVSSGVFEDKYAANIMRTRLSRLKEEERRKVYSLMKILDDPKGTNKDEILARFGDFIATADACDPLPDKSDVIECRYSIFERVWEDAQQLRSSGKLLALGQHIRCPVVAIHGDYDPHPADGVRIPLSRVIKNFRFILLENCGHRPWIERAAKNKFYDILREELRASSL